jgi:hypothetical protein
VTPIEEREAMSVIAPIELAAAFLAGACSAAYDGAVATSSAENGPTLYAVAEEQEAAPGVAARGAARKPAHDPS